MTTPLSDETFIKIRDYIYEKSGIYISDNKKYLIENRLGRILTEHSLQSFDEYIAMICSSRNGRHLRRLFDSITTNETFFFREARQLAILADEIVPRLLKGRKGDQPIRIWSAACSTGEEPYTISMMLMERRIMPSRLEIIASDLSERALSSARKAVYTSYSMRNVPEPYLNRYFMPNGGAYALKPEIKETVTFRKINLIDPGEVLLARKMDIILCRNALIYFDQHAKQKVVSMLYDSLRQGGFLFMGSTESLHSITKAFRSQVVNSVIYYEKV